MASLPSDTRALSSAMRTSERYQVGIAAAMSPEASPPYSDTQAQTESNPREGQAKRFGAKTTSPDGKAGHVMTHVCHHVSQEERQV